MLIKFFFLKFTTSKKTTNNKKRVICRFRPVNEKEKLEISQKDVPTLEFPDEHSVEIKIPKAKPSLFSFDYVFHSPMTTQKEVYDIAAKQTIEDVLSGYNGTIFAYVCKLVGIRIKNNVFRAKQELEKVLQCQEQM